MRGDLLAAISRHKDLTNVIVLTFNIDLLFVETVLLRTLRQCGHPTLTIFADAEEVSRTFNAQTRWLSGIGRRFRVIPVPMTRGNRFHPKAVFLSGQEEAELLVGSGNLTFGGFKQNEELWISFTSQDDEIGPMAAFRESLLACVERAPVSQGARREIDEAFDATTHIWARKMSTPDGLVWRIGEGLSLLERMALVVGDRLVDRLCVCSPYYDENGVGLKGLTEFWPQAATELLVQSGQSTLTQSAVDATSVKLRLLSIKSKRQDSGNTFIHAKFYAMFCGSEVLLFVGSANCSAAALTQSGKNGNAEMLAFKLMEAQEFDGQIVSELEVLEEAPKITHQRGKDESHDSAEKILILGASYESGSLTVAFTTNGNAKVDTCYVDNEVMKLASPILSNSRITVMLTQAPRLTHLEGTTNKERLSSRSHWVDHEFSLRTTSRQRKIVQAIESNISPVSWNFRSWAEIMRLLGDHLHYGANMPPRHSSDRGSDERTKTSVYVPADFFTTNYRLPSRSMSSLFLNEDDRIIGLQRLIAGYFGVEAGEISSHAYDEGEVGEDEAVDIPETISCTSRRKPATKRERQGLTKTESNRSRQLATRVIDQLLQEHFLRHRHQDLIATDLTIVAVLLIAGQNEGWLSPDLFFELTYKVWIHLFFNHGLPDEEKTTAAGWLELRVEQADDPESFLKAVGTVPLSAALAMWAFTCPTVAARPEKARFALATRTAVARLPWIWNLHRIDEVADEINRIASRTGWLREKAGRHWNDITVLWNRMLGEGRALAKFETVLADRSVTDWRSVIEVNEVKAGTLLWQGRLGFCVVKEYVDCKIDTGAIPVLLLRAERREANIMSSLILPAKTLLDAIAPKDVRLTGRDAELLTEFMRQVEGLTK